MALHIQRDAKKNNRPSANAGRVHAPKTVQAKTGTVDPALPALKQKNTTGLPDGLKAGIENLSGHRMDDVKVHFNSSQPAQLQAHGYAQGTDIHPGQERHLPHEAWHVVQQKQGRVKPTMQLKNAVAINDNPGLETEADAMGEKAGKTVTGYSTHPLQRLAVTGSSPVIQRYEMDSGPYASIIKDLNLIPSVKQLIEDRLKLGDLFIKQNKKDDTYWDRASSTIYVSGKKKGAAIKAAILFELNNAVNPHTHTDGIESTMKDLSEKEVELTGPDFWQVAQEMEKDEFISLQGYKQQVESGKFEENERKVLQQKYKSILNEDGHLDYDLFVEQNRSSGHTMELAKLQYTNYTKNDGDMLDDLMPLKIKEPSNYDQYQKGKMSSRLNKGFGEKLKKEGKRKLDTTTPELWKKQKKEVLKEDVKDITEKDDTIEKD